ncbi:MAG: hypothetical protein IKW00_06075 [Clostridia bacterium]|nr:hypothetical protein [Clostridia bacterium]
MLPGSVCSFAFSPKGSSCFSQPGWKVSSAISNIVVDCVQKRFSFLWFCCTFLENDFHSFPKNRKPASECCLISALFSADENDLQQKAFAGEILKTIF